VAAIGEVARKVMREALTGSSEPSLGALLGVVIAIEKVGAVRSVAGTEDDLGRSSRRIEKGVRCDDIRMVARSSSYGTLLKAWASLKSFQPRDKQDNKPDDPGNPTVDFHGRSARTTRTNRRPIRTLCWRAKAKARRPS